MQGTHTSAQLSSAKATRWGKAAKQKASRTGAHPHPRQVRPLNSLFEAASGDSCCLSRQQRKGCSEAAAVQLMGQEVHRQRASQVVKKYNDCLRDISVAQLTKHDQIS